MIAIVATVASAYETDQLTHRDQQLLDATPIADAIMNELLAEAVVRTNEATACAVGPDETHGIFAEEVREATSRSRMVWSRGVFRAPGFSIYSAALEESEADRFQFRHREDLFGDLTIWHSVILTLAGPCSTFEIAGVRVGSDKFDHFLDEGFTYWSHARADGDLRAAIARGTATERSFFGLLTSKAFSWSDLHANHEGYLFYEGLLGEDSVFEIQDGCVRQRSPFTWADWVDVDYDELLNPSTYTRLVERGILAHLERDRDEICAEREAWDPDGWREAHVAGLTRDPASSEGPTPGRRDPFQLQLLCAGGQPTVNPERPRHAIRDARKRQAR